MALRKLHLSNEEDKNTLVGYLSVKPKSPPTMAGPKGKPVEFTRYLACESKNLHESLKEKHGEEYGQALIEGDPELALEKAGLLIEETQEVFLGADGKMMHAPPGIEEVTYEPAGEEIKRGDAEEVFANVNEELPLVWTKHRIDRKRPAGNSHFVEPSKSLIGTDLLLIIFSIWQRNWLMPMRWY